MADNDREIYNPFYAPLHNMSVKEKAEAELAELWSLYLNGGGGMPWYYEGYSSLEGYLLSRQR